MICEFCRVPIPMGNELIIEAFPFHRDCLKRAIRALATIKIPEPKVKVNIHPKGNYLVIKNPNSTQDTRPRQHYETYKQARAVAEKLTLETSQDFWVMRHVSTVTIS